MKLLTVAISYEEDVIKYYGFSIQRPVECYRITAK